MGMIPQHRITPANVTALESDQVFVFGSNIAGKHGAGAAKLAKARFGAKQGVGRWMTGQCYAIPTKDFWLRTQSLEEIAEEVSIFAEFSGRRTDKRFIVTEIGCGLAGYKPEQIAPMFSWAIGQENILLPFRFWEIILKNRNNEGID
jgi:hypothetical protein